MDFRLRVYKELLIVLKEAGYHFYTMEDFVTRKIDKKSVERIVVLRHDVDRRARNSLETAKIENSLAIPASYYFRIVKESFVEDIIESIAHLGHEIGYHYEDLALSNGNYENAIQEFANHLNIFRKYYPVKTICMHGNPMSKWDNRLLWERYNYKDYGIICEPYFDINFSHILYLTDTGRRWDGSNVNVRDKVTNTGHFTQSFRSTHQIIKAIKENDFPETVIINSHPERWDDKFIPWFTQLILQNAKNIVKAILIKKSNYEGS